MENANEKGGGDDGGDSTVEKVDDGDDDEQQQIRNKKLEKARKKREKARAEELERERRIKEETEAAGPSPRIVESETIARHLQPLQLAVREVEADGHCLYRAVAAQLASGRSNCDDDPAITMNYTVVRNLCADSLLQHRDAFSPFCEYTDQVPDFDCYVARVRNSADWGGHLELRAISMAAQRPIWVYRASSSQPLVVDDTNHADSAPNNNSSGNEPIRLSYHLNYYALGEHYNQVVSIAQDK